MKVGALLVAAGMSSRMKAFKPLLKIGGKSMIAHGILSFQEAGVDEIVVVVGNHSKELEEELKQFHVTVLYNPAYEKTEMFDSAKLGLQYLKQTCDIVLFTPADIPLFSPVTVNKLLTSNATIAKPVYNGRGGHPLLLTRKHLDTICDYKGNMGMKGALFKCKETVQRVEVDDPGILMDADTKEEFQNILKYYKNSCVF